ncbi:MAG: NADPH:quinone reductase [Chloroflexi bacterium]|nr:NADPH:quinone reductase [Chloroflexota bacterium]
MLAAWYERLGAAGEVIEVGERPTPTAGPGEVRVRLVASAVNPADCKRRAGIGFEQEFPVVIPNSDGAGVIDQVGEGVPDSRLGQRVWLYNGQRGRAFGTAAQYIALDASLVHPLPDSVDFAAGACFGIPCMTAYCCVFAQGPVASKTVLVTGGAGAVGHYAVQWAAWGGGTVIATASSSLKLEQAREAGAAHVVNYREADVAARVREVTNGAGVDHIVDVDFGGNLPVSAAILRRNGSIASYASTGDPTPVFPFYDLMRRCVTVRLVLLNQMPKETLDRACADVGRWLAGGQRLHRVAARFSLERIAQAHLAVESGTKLGTVVVDIP